MKNTRRTKFQFAPTWCAISSARSRRAGSLINLCVFVSICGSTTWIRLSATQLIPAGFSGRGRCPGQSRGRFVVAAHRWCRVACSGPGPCKRHRCAGPCNVLRRVRPRAIRAPHHPPAVQPPSGSTGRNPRRPECHLIGSA